MADDIILVSPTKVEKPAAKTDKVHARIQRLISDAELMKQALKGFPYHVPKCSVPTQLKAKTQQARDTIVLFMSEHFQITYDHLIKDDWSFLPTHYEAIDSLVAPLTFDIVQDGLPSDHDRETFSLTVPQLRVPLAATGASNYGPFAFLNKFGIFETLKYKYEVFDPVLTAIKEIEPGFVPPWNGDSDRVHMGFYINVSPPNLEELLIAFSTEYKLLTGRGLHAAVAVAHLHLTYAGYFSRYLFNTLNCKIIQRFVSKTRNEQLFKYLNWHANEQLLGNSLELILPEADPLLRASVYALTLVPNALKLPPVAPLTFRGTYNWKLLIDWFGQPYDSDYAEVKISTINKAMGTNYTDDLYVCLKTFDRLGFPFTNIIPGHYDDLHRTDFWYHNLEFRMTPAEFLAHWGLIDRAFLIAVIGDDITSLSNLITKHSKNLKFEGTPFLLPMRPTPFRYSAYETYFSRLVYPGKAMPRTNSIAEIHTKPPKKIDLSDLIKDYPSSLGSHAASGASILNSNHSTSHASAAAVPSDEPFKPTSDISPPPDKRSGRKTSKMIKHRVPLSKKMRFLGIKRVKRVTQLARSREHYLKYSGEVYVNPMIPRRKLRQEAFVERKKKQLKMWKKTPLDIIQPSLFDGFVNHQNPPPLTWSNVDLFDIEVDPVPEPEWYNEPPELFYEAYPWFAKIKYRVFALCDAHFELDDFFRGVQFNMWKAALRAINRHWEPDIPMNLIIDYANYAIEYARENDDIDYIGFLAAMKRDAWLSDNDDGYHSTGDSNPYMKKIKEFIAGLKKMVTPAIGVLLVAIESVVMLVCSPVTLFFGTILLSWYCFFHYGALSAVVTGLLGLWFSVFFGGATSGLCQKLISFTISKFTVPKHMKKISTLLTDITDTHVTIIASIPVVESIFLAFGGKKVEGGIQFTLEEYSGMVDREFDDPEVITPTDDKDGKIEISGIAGELFQVVFNTKKLPQVNTQLSFYRNFIATWKEIVAFAKVALADMYKQVTGEDWLNDEATSIIRKISSMNEHALDVLTRARDSADWSADSTRRAEVKNLYVEYMEFTKTLLVNPPPKVYMDAYNKVFASIKEIAQPIIDADASERSRPVPITFYLYGDPDLGKSAFGEALCAALEGKAGNPMFDRSQIYYKPPNDKFWSGYTPRKLITKMDEFFQGEDDLMRREECLEIIRCVNDSYYKLNMPDLASKMNTYFISKYLIITTNLGSLPPCQKLIKEPKALYRRLHYCIRVVRKPNTGSFSKDWQFELTHVDGQRVTDPVTGNQLFPPPTKFDDLVEFIYERSTKASSSGDFNAFLSQIHAENTGSDTFTQLRHEAHASATSAAVPYDPTDEKDMPTVGPGDFLGHDTLCNKLHQGTLTTLEYLNYGFWYPWMKIKSIKDKATALYLDSVIKINTVMALIKSTQITIHWFFNKFYKWLIGIGCGLALAGAIYVIYSLFERYNYNSTSETKAKRRLIAEGKIMDWMEGHGWHVTEERYSSEFDVFISKIEAMVSSGVCATDKHIEVLKQFSPISESAIGKPVKEWALNSFAPNLVTLRYGNSNFRGLAIDAYTVMTVAHPFSDLGKRPVCIKIGGDASDYHDYTLHIPKQERDLAFICLCPPSQLLNVRSLRSAIPDKADLGSQRYWLARSFGYRTGTVMPCYSLATPDEVRYEQFVNRGGLVEAIGVTMTGDSGAPAIYDDRPQIFGIQAANRGTGTTLLIAVTSDDLPPVRPQPNFIPTSQKPAPDYAPEYGHTIGISIEPHHVPSKSKLLHSPLYGDPDLATPTMEPAMMHKTGDVSPFKKGLEKFQSTPLYSPNRQLIGIYAGVVNDRLRAPKIKRTLTFEEALFGIPGTSIRGYDRTASSGSFFRKRGKPTKGSVVDDPASFALLKTRTLAFVHSLESGVPVGYYVEDFLKDELRSPEKARTGNTRFVSQVEFEYYLGCKMILGPFLEGFYSMEYGFSATGLNPHGPDWAKTLEDITFNGKTDIAVCYDIKNWDGRVKWPWHVQGAIFTQFWKRHAIESPIEPVLLLLSCFRNHIHVLGNLVYSVANTMASGDIVTACINTTNHMILLLDAYTHITGDSPTTFFMNACPKLMSDDNVTGILHRISDKFNNFTIRDHYRIAGIEMTAPDKKGELQPTYNIKDVTFLKRRFAPMNGIVQAPMDLLELQDRLQWMRKSKEPVPILMRMKVMNYLYESSHHGPVVYEASLSLARKWSTHHKWDIIFPSYPEAVLQRRACEMAPPM